MIKNHDFTLGAAILSLLFAVPSGAAEALTVTSPMNFQVVQQDELGIGKISISGAADETVEEVRYRISGKPLKGKLPEDWQRAKLDPKAHSYRADLDLPAGGWYQLEISANAQGKQVATSLVEKFGVGEVFIVAGQSNAGNYGSAKTTSLSGLVASFDGKSWSLAADPLRGAGGNSGSFMPSFGDGLHAKLQVPIGILPLAAGGTSVREWLPAGTRFAQQPTTGQNVKAVGNEFEATGGLSGKLTAAIDSTGKTGFRAVLWHQGESDAGQARSGYPADRQITGAQYAGFMKLLIDSSRKHAGWDIPWITAVTTYHSEADAQDEEFRAAQQSLWKNGLAIQGPDTDELRKEYRAGVHFNEKGLKKHGELWAEHVLAWLNR